MTLHSAVQFVALLSLGFGRDEKVGLFRIYAVLTFIWAQGAI